MTIIYQGRRISVERKLINLPNKREKEVIVVHTGGAVAILPCDGDDCYLIRQFRPAMMDYIYEAPAGTIEPGESPQETAARELIEETRLSSEELIPRGTIMTSPGYSDEVLHLFEARGLSLSDDFDPDDDEVIDVIRLSRREAELMASDGRINDAKTICLLFRCRSDDTNQ